MWVSEARRGKTGRRGGRRSRPAARSARSWPAQHQNGRKDPRTGARSRSAPVSHRRGRGKGGRRLSLARVMNSCEMATDAVRWMRWMRRLGWSRGARARSGRLTLQTERERDKGAFDRAHYAVKFPGYESRAIFSWKDREKGRNCTREAAAPNPGPSARYHSVSIGDHGEQGA